MRDMTAANLRSAFGGESMASQRYKVWGAKAEEEGFQNVGRLFRAIAHAEQAHARNHFIEMGGVPGEFLVASMAGFGIGSTSQNLQAAIEGELFEVNEMYPAYRETAQSQDERGAVRSFFYATSAEATHARMFQRAKDAVDGGQDMDLQAVHVCEVCGYTHEGDPEVCPTCGAATERFIAFEG
jgi:rubrerythrin